VAVDVLSSTKSSIWGKLISGFSGYSNSRKTRAYQILFQDSHLVILDFSRYKVLIRLLYSRHGEGYHNVAESYYGTPAWNVSFPSPNSAKITLLIRCSATGPSEMVTELLPGRTHASRRMESLKPKRPMHSGPHTSSAKRSPCQKHITPPP
jgi:hypothetical protein